MASMTDAAGIYWPEALAAQRLVPDILDRIQIGFYAIDQDWRVVEANCWACELWGTEPQIFVGHVLWECFPQLACSTTGRQLREAGGAKGASEFEVLSPDDHRCLWVRVDPLHSGLIGVYSRDITDRKRAEEAQRDSEARFRRVFEQSPLAMATAGPDFRFREVNPALCQMLGYSLDELIGASFLDFVHPDDCAVCLQHGTAMAAGQLARLQLEERFLQKSGEPIWVKINVGPIRDTNGALLYTLGIIENIEDRRQIEAELRRLADELERRVRDHASELAETRDRLQRERLISELIVESTAEGIIVIDNDMRHLLWNAGMERINGLPRKKVLGKTVFEVFPHLADNTVGQAWRDALAGRRTGLRGRRYFAPARGVEVVYDADHEPLYDHSGAIIGAVAIVRDTTERHRIEEMLRQSQKMEAVAQLTRGVAHDFNNLLTAVIGCLELISSEAGNKRLQSLAQTALRSASRGAQLTHQLLSFARQQELNSMVTNLDHLLADMEILLRRAAGETIQMEFESEPRLWSCAVDPAQFEAAVLNLVMNAHDAMPEGGRLLLSANNLHAADIPSGVDLLPGEYVAFRVRDTGEGMTPDVMARAFDPFFTTKEVGKGSGLGLSMVYGFAKQSGGGVHLESKPGEGTCITIYLPRKEASLEPDKTADSIAAAPQQGAGSILVVEDDADVREVTVAMLELLGYRALVVGNALEALTVLRSPEDIDLLFTDLVMPLGMSGLELARQAVEMRPGLKVLLTSGYAGRQGPASDEFPLLPKPFRPNELGAALQELMRGRGGDGYGADFSGNPTGISPNRSD
jgi:PAS domain S-box-containing protein